MRDHPALFTKSNNLNTILTKNSRNQNVISTSREAQNLLMHPTAWGFPSTRRSPEHFLCLFQVQHIIIGLCEELSGPKAHVRMQAICGKSPSNITPDDVDLNKLSYTKLIVQPNTAKIHGVEETVKIP